MKRDTVMKVLIIVLVVSLVVPTFLVALGF